MEDLIPLENVVLWRWRCLSEGKIILGPDLCLAGFPTMFRLSDYTAPNVDREKLRCACGSAVIPLAPNLQGDR